MHFSETGKLSTLSASASAGDIKRYLAVADAVVKGGDAVRFLRTDLSLRGKQHTRPVEKMINAISIHGPAFSAGLISLKRLLDVAITPFLRLLESQAGRSEPSKAPPARKIGVGNPSDDPDFVLNIMFCVWVTALEELWREARLSRIPKAQNQAAGCGAVS